MLDKKKQLQLDYKGNRCVKCNKTVQEVLERFGTISQIFHFNHINPSKKHPKYDNVIRRAISTEVLDELDKCVLLCSFCHGILHGQNVVGECTIKVRHGDSTYEQTVNMQGIIEINPETQSPAFFFFPDGPLSIELYQVFVPGETPVVYSLGQLQSGELFLKLISNTKKVGSFEIRNLQDEQVLIVEKVDENRFSLRFRVGFPLIRAELCFDGNGSTDIWLRNGMAVHRSGEIQRDGRYRLVCPYLPS